ncbi:Urease accessory protein ureD [Termitomyces sp. J132]|nr:Urease accessory protein ureD [Termitomyces sp. J132]
MLSQGSTKVFKVRSVKRLASVRPSPGSPVIDHQLTTKATMQNLSFTIAAGGTLLLLPDPLSSQNASIVVLDWLTSGRMSIGEEWAFSRYYSVNEVWVEGKRVARDVMLLDEEQVESINKVPVRTINDRLAPYSCYATVILYGPLVESIILRLTASYSRISIFKTKVPGDILWSLSPMTSDSGAIVRVAGKETETVRRWLGQCLEGLQDVIGREVYQKAFQ